MNNKLFFTILFIFSAGIAGGHGLGQSFEQKAGNYVIDVGYDAIDKIYSVDTVHFDFNLWKENRMDMADFDHVWVRIAPKDKGILFTGFLYRPDFLLTGMSYTFEVAGEYDLTVRFLNKNDETLAEASFPLTVEKKAADKTEIFKIIGAGVIGLLVGLILSSLFKDRKL